MCALSSETRLTTVGVVGPPSVAARLRNASSAIEADTSVEWVGGTEEPVPDPVDCVVAATASTGTEQTDGGIPAPTADILDWVTEVAARPTTPPIVLLAPADTPVTDALQAGVAEYLPQSVLQDAPETVLRRAVDATAEAGVAAYQTIYDNVSEPLTLHDPETGELVHANQRLCDLLGYDRTDLIAMEVGDYTADVEGYNQTTAMEEITSATSEGVAGPIEWPLETKDGKQVWVEATLTPVEIGGRERVLSTATDVTDRIRREQEYEQIFHGVNDVITIHDPETGEYIQVNDTLCDLTGYSREEILEMGIDGVSVTEEGYTAERAKEFIQRVVETGESDTVEWKVKTADGEHRWLEVNGSLATIGGRERVITLDRDITEVKRRQRAYEQIFDGVNDAIAVFDPETAEIVDVNERYHELLGYDDLDRIQDLGIEGLSVTEEGYTGDRGRELIAEVARTGEPQTVEWQAERRDGDRVWLEVTLATATILGEQRVLSIQRDITERKRREQEYEQIFNGVPGPITINDPETGELLAVNDALCDVLGYSREEVLELGNGGLAADEQGYDGETAASIVQRVVESGEPETFDWKLETATGQTRVLEVTGKPVEIGGEQRYVSLTRDVTEQRRREQEFEQIFHGVTDIINVYDPETGELLDVNDTMCELLGYDRDRILEEGPDGISATELGYDGELVEQVVREVAETGEPARDLEWALRTANGETLWLEVNATPAEINGRDRVLAIARDVTERRDREERVQVLNRVLRHNLRNDMDAIKAYATDIERAVEDERLRDHARRIGKTADALVRLSTKARSTEAVLRENDRSEASSAGKLLSTVLAEARDQFEAVEFSVTVTNSAEGALVERSVFRLVLRELVENAAEHGGDRVTARLTATPAADKITVEVADNGPGIPDRVLTPLRSGGETQLEHNQGLGLWLVNWGVRRLGGRIEFERPDDGGTVAVLRVPVVDE